MRIARPIAKRIDRLALRAHRFHRYAHHPLCGEYRGELVRLGRRARVCRGCLYCALGAACGVAAGCALPLGLGAWLAVAVAALALLVATRTGRTHSSVSGQLRVVRSSKLWIRFAPAAAALCAFALGLRRFDGYGFTLCAVTLAACAAYYRAYRKRGPDRTPCASCPERTGTAICSGYAPIVRRERALQRVAGRWLSA